MEKGNYPNANFQGASFSAAILNEVKARGATFQNGKSNFLEASNADFSNTNWSQAKVYFGTLKDVVFHNALLVEADFFSSDLRNSDFSGSDLRSANFAFADLRGVNFKDCDLTGALFTGALLEGAQFNNATIANTDFLGAVSGKFQLSDFQKLGACRHSARYGRSTDDSFYVDYKIRLMNRRKSNKFSSGYEHDDIYLNDLCSWGVRHAGFNDKTLPLCSDYDQYYSFSGDKTIRVDNSYAGQANRLNRFKERMNNHCQLLERELEISNGILRGSGMQKQAWANELEKNSTATQLTAQQFLNKDLLAILLTKAGYSIDTTTWKNIAYDRYNLEFDIFKDHNAEFGRFTAWPRFFPEQMIASFTPASEFPSNLLDSYIKWSKNRVKSVEDKIVVQVPAKFPIYAQNTKDTIAFAKFLECYALYSSCVMNRDVQRLKKSSDIAPQQTMKVPIYKSGYRHYEDWYFVFPNSTDSYNFPIPDFSLIQQADRPMFEFELELEAIDQFNTKQQKATYLFRVKPMEFRVTAKGETKWKFKPPNP